MNRPAKGLREVVKGALLSLQAPARGASFQVLSSELRGIAIRWPAALAWLPSWRWVEPLFHGLRARVPVTVQDIPQRFRDIVAIEFCRGDRSFPVGINFSDRTDLTSLVQDIGTTPPLALEFKMQFRSGGYGIDKVVPGGFVPGSVLVDVLARGPRRERNRQRFSYDVYGRFGLELATQIRTRALEALCNQSRVRFHGGGDKVTYDESLTEIARSRVCIDLPGNGPLCFRLVDYFAVGACVVSPPHAVTLPVPLRDRIHIVYTRPDMSDLVDLCEHYVTNDAAREAVMRASRRYYRDNLYWRSLSDYYLRTMLDRLPA